ncbi:transcription antitermination factor NusB [Rivihabitans pingtungensis]|jgi:N utilization substance protein B|uniref:Transcription antitermination protein NusB n=1 Tax=Rivihabitans pingtungensis TaxID=1054498 RepID=A0A318KT08_9NEIS|nr:transcription antitermination factor NusB [Rivihabitans pingtungensis]MCK6436183.1 transcription antitermination factor NusB [Rivihabitans pingtungensis]PXX75812.1 NusB antitermination factor [Rivihabitans pingtungensis]HNX70782.1 transcription antitermination factor NusB [Rivihabitans pingtungensis]
MKTARRRAREFAVQGVYQWQLNAHTASTIEKNLRENEFFAKADEALFRTLLFGVLQDIASLDEQLQRHYERAPEEVSPVERAILRVAALELTQHPETPYPVIINEAIEIAKTFGGADGHKFVNGVLDKLAADVRADEVEAQKRQRRNSRAG